jgi:hypothetical protein
LHSKKRKHFLEIWDRVDNIGRENTVRKKKVATNLPRVDVRAKGRRCFLRKNIFCYSNAIGLWQNLIKDYRRLVILWKVKIEAEGNYKCKTNTLFISDKLQCHIKLICVARHRSFQLELNVNIRRNIDRYFLKLSFKRRNLF